MGKPKERKVYTPTNEQYEAYLYCIRRDIAFSVKKINMEGDEFWIQRYKPSKYNIISNLRKNKSIPDIPVNRIILNEYEASKRVYELYLETMKHMEGIKDEIIEVKEEKKIRQTKTKSVKPKKENKNTQVDLLDMIKEVEDENADKAKQIQ